MTEGRRVRVKVCGLTRPEDARASAAQGADAVGLVFHPSSPRAVTPEQARAILATLPPFTVAVGLFVDPAPERVAEVLAGVPLDRLQFHGDESPAFCAGFGRPFIKAVRMREGVDVAAEARRFAEASALLLDAYVPETPGGTGTTFAWERVPGDLPLPVVLAGGLSPANVAEAVARVRPYAVDVSSGVEAAPGIKDPQRIAAFIRGATNG